MASVTVNEDASGGVIRGILLMILAGFMFSLLDATAKFLGPYMHPLEISWLRFVTHVLVVFLIFRVWERPSQLKVNDPKMQILRGLCMCGSTGFNFAAVQYLQLTEAAAIMFAAPLVVTALSGPLLGEWAGWRRWAAVIVGFLGVALVTRPGFGEVHWAVLLSFGAMLSYALYILLTRRLGSSEETGTLLIWPGFVGVALFAPLAAPVFEVPALPLWPIVLLMGVFGAYGHYVLILAHKLATPNVLAPFAYTQMIWMIVLGFVLFGDLPDVWTMAGTAIVAASGLYILHRERVRSLEASVRDPAVQ